MNKKGQVSLSGLMYAPIIIIGLIMAFSMFTVLFPILDTYTACMPNSAAIDMFVDMIPMILALLAVLGVIGVAAYQYLNPPQRQQY